MKMYELLSEKSLSDQTYLNPGASRAKARGTNYFLLVSATLAVVAAPASAETNFWQGQLTSVGYTASSAATDNRPFPNSPNLPNQADAHYSGFEGAGWASVTGTTFQSVKWYGDPSVPVSTKLLLLQRIEVDSQVSLHGPGNLGELAASADLKTFTNLGGDGDDILESGDGWANRLRISKGFKVQIVDNPDRFSVVGVTKVFGNASASLGGLPEGVSCAGGLKYESMIWPMGYEIQVRRRGTNDPFSANALTAAGGVAEADEHVSDVRVHFLGVDPNLACIIAHQKDIHDELIDLAPRLLRGNGVLKNAHYEPSFDSNISFDDNSVYLGTIVSSDRSLIQDDQVGVEFPIPENYIASPNDYTVGSVNFTGDTANQWFTGANSDIPYDGRFNYNEPKTVTFKPNFNGVPITKHSLNISAIRVSVDERNPATGAVVSKIYTTDQSEANDTLPVPVIYKEDLGEYVSFSQSDVTDSGGGIYSTQMTIQHNPDKLVTKVELQSRDHGVFDPKL